MGISLPVPQRVFSPDFSHQSNDVTQRGLGGATGKRVEGEGVAGGSRGKFQETLVVELGSLVTNHYNKHIGMTRDNGMILFTWICFLGDL